MPAIEVEGMGMGMGTCNPIAAAKGPGLRLSLSDAASPAGVREGACDNRRTIAGENNDSDAPLDAAADAAAWAAAVN